MRKRERGLWVCSKRRGSRTSEDGIPERGLCTLSPEDARNVGHITLH